MKYTLIFFCLCMAACQPSSTNDKIISSSHAPISTFIGARPTIPYQTAIQQRDTLKWRCKRMNKKEAGIALATFVDSVVFPYWYGTPWDYNGVTQVPNEGYIACGYFVTTVLRDAGVQINRVKMAQCASEQMIKSLTSKLEHFSNQSFSQFIAKVKQHGIGLFVIGLDNHTGFLYNDGRSLYFVHSSFVGTGRVIKEEAETNSILINSSYKVVGYLTEDATFIQHWLNTGMRQ